MFWLDHTEQNPNRPTHLPRCPYLQSWLAPVPHARLRPEFGSLSWKGVWDVGLPGAVDKQVGDLQWWSNHLLGPSEGWATSWTPWGCTSLLKMKWKGPVHVSTCTDPMSARLCAHWCCTDFLSNDLIPSKDFLREREGSWRKTVVPYVSQYEMGCSSTWSCLKSYHASLQPFG